PVSVRDVGDRRDLDRVTGDDQHLDVAFGQVAGDLERERGDPLGGRRTVREAAVVAHVQDRFVRQKVEDGAGDGEAADAGVEDAVRPRGAHPFARSRLPLPRPPSASPVYHHKVSETFFSARSSSGAHAWVDRYFHPPSARRHTTSPRSSSDATRRPTWSTAPDEMPAKTPSRSVS